MLRGEDVLMSVAAGFGVGRGGTAHKGEAAGVAWSNIAVLATPSSPVQPDAVVARLTALGAIGACRLLLAALDFARFAGPAAGATSFLWLSASFFLRPWHSVD